ncbi:MAG: hypothetical protein ACRCYO_09915 [Bacteroidia bacterium]
MHSDQDEFDSFFRSHYERVDVQENPEHWKRMQTALALATTVIVAKPLLVKLFLAHKYLLTGIALGATIATTILVIHFQRPNPNNSPESTPSIQQLNPIQTNPNPQIPNTQQITDQENKKDDTVFMPRKQQDTLVKSDSLHRDSIPSKKADSVIPKKKKTIIF